MSDQRDDDLLAELRQAASRFDPVPADVVAGARAAFVWRSMDTELAELVADTSQQDRVPAGVRGAEPAMLSFEAPSLVMELEILPERGGRRVLGQLVPPQPGRIEVRHAGGTLQVDVDAVGRFSAGDVMPGPVSLRCQPSVGSPVETDWFLA